MLSFDIVSSIILFFDMKRRLIHRNDHEGKSLAYVYFENEPGG